MVGWPVVSRGSLQWFYHTGILTPVSQYHARLLCAPVPTNKPLHSVSCTGVHRYAGLGEPQSWLATGRTAFSPYSFENWSPTTRIHLGTRPGHTCYVSPLGPQRQNRRVEGTGWALFSTLIPPFFISLDKETKALGRSSDSTNMSHSKGVMMKLPTPNSSLWLPLAFH